MGGYNFFLREQELHGKNEKRKLGDFLELLTCAIKNDVTY